MLLSDNELLLSRAGLLFAAISMRRHWTLPLMPVTHVILGNYVLGKCKFIFYFLLSVLRNIQVCSSWDGEAQQQKKALENGLVKKSSGEKLIYWLSFSLEIFMHHLEKKIQVKFELKMYLSGKKNKILTILSEIGVKRDWCSFKYRPFKICIEMYLRWMINMRNLSDRNNYAVSRCKNMSYWL